MFKKVMAILLSICILFSLTGCSLKQSVRNATIQVSTKMGQAKLTEYLHKKYPEKTFSVEQVDEIPMMDELTNPYEAVSDEEDAVSMDATRAIVSFWKMIDENNDVYYAAVNNLGVAEKDSFAVIDNVQEKEINDAIYAELYRIFGVEETENNFFVHSGYTGYADAKFDGDITDFFQQSTLWSSSKDTDIISCVYFYNNDISFDSALKTENYDFLKYVSSYFVKYRENLPTKEWVLEYQKKNRYAAANRMALFVSELTSVEAIHKINAGEYYRTETDKWLYKHEFEMLRQDNVRYCEYISNDGESGDAIDLIGENIEDMSVWETTMQTYQKDNNEKWVSYRAITKKYQYTSEQEHFYYYVDKPENAENKRYYVFASDKNGKMYIKSLNHFPYAQPFLRNLTTKDIITCFTSGTTRDAIFLSPFDSLAGTDGKWLSNWFVVECEIEPQ